MKSNLFSLFGFDLLLHFSLQIHKHPYFLLPCLSLWCWHCCLDSYG